MIVAQITKDHESANDPEFNQKDRIFTYDAMESWWGWDDLPETTDWLPEERTTFKLYDADDNLYYEGWLLNDHLAIVQQFVLDWGKYNAGCTTILVHKPNPVPGSGGGEYVQEIG